MQHLIVLSHPNPKSFSKAIARTIADTLEKNDTPYVLRDLYNLHFNPVLSYKDLGRFIKKDIPIDIKMEQEHILNSDFIHFIYPNWWTGLPAMLKGYVDRVFSKGFAYGRIDGEITGLLGGKKAILYTPQGESVENYNQSGMLQSIRMTSDVGIFNFCNIEVIEHFIYGSITKIKPEDRTKILQDVAEFVTKL